jgi:hypothetical protein
MPVSYQIWMCIAGGLLAPTPPAVFGRPDPSGPLHQALIHRSSVKPTRDPGGRDNRNTIRADRTVKAQTPSAALECIWKGDKQC